MTGLWATSQSLRGFFSALIQQAKDYSATNADNSIGEHIEFLRKSMTFVREAPLIGHGTGSLLIVSSFSHRTNWRGWRSNG